MEKETHTQQQANAIRQVMPQKEASTSLVLNGIGNGMMIGTIPFVALELYSHIAEKKIHKAAYISNAFAMGAGCALGAWFGMHEAKRLQAYRETLVGEVNQLQDRVDVNCKKLDQWANKVAASDTTSPEKSR